VTDASLVASAANSILYSYTSAQKKGEDDQKQDGKEEDDDLKAAAINPFAGETDWIYMCDCVAFFEKKYYYYY
jgi:hypothetical protein